MSNLTITELSMESISDLKRWKQLVSGSPQGNIFFDLEFLNLMNVEYKAYFIVKGGQLIVAGLIYSIKDGQPVLNNAMVYNGIFFAKPDPLIKANQNLANDFEISKFTIQFLTQKYDSIQLSLHPNFLDLRPFLWHNYHEGRRFKHELRYTSYLTCKNEKFDEKTFLEFMGRSRRQELKNALKSDIQISFADSAISLISPYKKTMEQQGIYLKESWWTNIENTISQLISNNKGLLITSKDHHTNNIIASAFFGISDSNATYLWGGTNPELRNGFEGTLVLFKGIQKLFNELNIHEIDLEGVNSPSRGWFKLGFGGSLTPYFEVEY